MTSISELIELIEALYNLDWDGDIDGPAGAVGSVIETFLNGAVDFKGKLKELKSLLDSSDTGVRIERISYPLFRKDQCTISMALNNGYKFKIHWTRNYEEQKRINDGERFRGLLNARTVQLNALRDQFMQYALNTRPADRNRLEKAIGRIYERIGLPHPEIIWFSSLTEAAFVATMLDMRSRRIFREAEAAPGQASPSSSDLFFEYSVQSQYHFLDFLARGCSRYFNFPDDVDAASTRYRSTLLVVEGSTGRLSSQRRSKQLGHQLIRQELDSALSLNDGGHIGEVIARAIALQLALPPDEAATFYPDGAELVEMGLMLGSPSKLQGVFGRCAEAMIHHSELHLELIGMIPRSEPCILGFRGRPPDTLSLSLFHSPFDSFELLRIAAFNSLGGVQTDDCELFLEAVRSGGWWAPFANICIASENVAVLQLDNRLRLHNETGPALVFPDGASCHAIHGVFVPAQVVERQFSFESIAAEKNTEVRRVMIELYGFERYLADSGAQEVHRDECGVLYRITFADDEPLMLVRVVNSTPEFDGTRKTYVLRVPPNMVTARQAVAWSFRMSINEYEPLVET